MSFEDEDRVRIRLEAERGQPFERGSENAFGYRTRTGLWPPNHEPSELQECSVALVRISEVFVEVIRERDEARAKLAATESDRDEWKKQHENAVECWRADQVALSAKIVELQKALADK